MKLNLLTKYKHLSRLLYRNVGYYADCSYELSGESFAKCNHDFPILIVARQYYSEQWTSYPAISLSELKNILKLQSQSVSDERLLHQWSVNEEQEGFDVKTISFSIKLPEYIKPHTVLIPETELLVCNNHNHLVYQLATPLGELFWARTAKQTHSVYKKGLLTQTGAFKMSIGYPGNAEEVALNQQAYLRLIKESIENTPLAKLFSICSVKLGSLIKVKKLHQVYWSPVVCALCFLLMTNGYYLFLNSQLDDKLSSYGSQVNKLLNIKVKQDKASNFIKVANDELNSSALVHSHWNIVYEAVRQKMHVQQFRKREGNFIIRGLAKNSSSVLTAINALPVVESATFKGTVRKSRGKDSFIIQLKLVGE